MYEKNLHGEWLSLIEVSGPFLAEPVLEHHFPQGLDELASGKKKVLRQAYDEWREAQDQDDPQFLEIHQAWIELVLKEGLELDEDNDGDVLKPSDALPSDIKLDVPEHDVTLTPDFAVIANAGERPRMLIQTFPAGVDFDNVSKADGWAATPAERMIQLCRATTVRLGLLTNGERWMLIDAPEGGVTTFASWYARLWGQEPITLSAFVSLFGIRRFFLDTSHQLPALLDESLKHQDEVTDALGDQVRRAIEVLVQALDKADQDRGRELLRDVAPTELYEAGLTIMMRLVFLLSAEERDLLLLGDERYEAYYAVSTLRMQLREQAGLHSEEVLSHRRDAWARLLATFRAVYGGVEHETLRMPALGGSLFDPDRFPFLEGRAKGSNWRYDPAQPLPIDNRTVLLLLDAIQLFQGRTLSYRALDVEQIGYVYEGLLERTVARAKDITLELEATKKSKQPWVTLGELESKRLDGHSAVIKLLEERTGSSHSRIKNDLGKDVSDWDKDRLLTACQNDPELRDRLEPYFHFLRIDPWGYPLVFPENSFMVVTGSNRRETGTHYTPKSLTESIVKETLEPVVYSGPAEGKEREDWQLKSPKELLDLKVCDPAMGSGAFLVQVCRWLSERLLEAWSHAEAQGKAITADGKAVDRITSQEPLSKEPEERSIAARRLIAERCLYGVDINPLAVELSKLSIWLVTLAKGRPFGFLDHNLRHGDSLLGISDLDQLLYLDMKVEEGSGKNLFAQKIDQAVKEAIGLRKALRQQPILDIHDVEIMEQLDQQARDKLELLELIANSLTGETLKVGGKQADASMVSIEAGQAFDGNKDSFVSLRRRAQAGLSTDLPDEGTCRKPLHWCLEFPEVFFSNKKGFDAVVGNPPFLGNTSIRGSYGKAYRDFLTEVIAEGRSGKADLVVFFFLKSFKIVAESGYLGLIATSSISEGESKEVGLRHILGNGGAIYNATPMLKWPGSASVVVSIVHITKGAWDTKKALSGIEVEFISDNLTPGERWIPVKLEKNLGLVFKGTEPNGEGFIVEAAMAEKLIQESPENQDVLFPYLIAKDVNQNPSQGTDRWIVNFWDWSERKSSKYAVIFRLIENEVKPIRQRQKPNGEYVLGKTLAEKWWLLKRTRPELYHKIGRGAAFDYQSNLWKKDIPQKRVIVFARGATKFPSFSYVNNDQIFGDSLCVIACDSAALLAVLSSDMHTIWAWEFGGRKTHDLRYIQDDVFETFPFPDGVFDDNHKQLSQLGDRFGRLRSQYMLENGKGMTKFYNDLHDPSIQNAATNALRDIQAEINNTVLEAYDFTEIDLEHGFHEVAYLPDGKNTRFTISEQAREKLLYRLATLNKQRHESESNKKTNVVKLKSATRKYGKKAPTPVLKVAEPQPDLFGSIDTQEAKPKGNQWGGNAVDQIYGWLEANQDKWFPKELVLRGSGADPTQWEEAVKELLADGDIAQQGEGAKALFKAVL